MTQTDRHEIDVTETADRIDVAEDAIRGVLDQAPDELTVTAIHGYWGAIAIAETEPKLSAEGIDLDPYTLLSFNGHAFPFHPTDVDLLEYIMGQTDHEFEKRGKKPYTG